MNISKLCCYNRIFRFLYEIDKLLFSKNFSYFLDLLIAFTKIFVFHDGQIIEVDE